MDHRTLFDLGRSITRRAPYDARFLLDHQLDLRTTALIVQDPDVFETHQGPQDLTRVHKDEGASCFLAHTSSLKRLRHLLGDPRGGRLPVEIRRATFFGADDGIRTRDPHLGKAICNNFATCDFIHLPMFYWAFDLP